MKLKAINCENMGAILVHQQKPDGAPTDLVAEVHSGFEDAKHIAECVNAAANQDENAAIFGVKYPTLHFALNPSSAETAEIRRVLEQEKMKMVLAQWPEDVADHPVDPTIIQGGIVGKPVEAAGRIPELMKEQLKHFMAIAVHHQHCRLSALEALAQAEADRDELLAAFETLLDGVDLQAPEGFTPENADGVLCGRTVSVFDLIRCAEIVARVKGGAA